MGQRRESAMSSTVLSEYLEEWGEHLEASGQSRLSRILKFMRESLTAGAIIVVMTVLALVDTVFESEGRPLSERVSMRTFCGGFSSFVSYDILAYRKPLMWKALRHAQFAATELQSEATPAGRVSPSK
ncbi:uncharacterized protein LOC117639927 [Thrips palmi]|uniref:Uncharacterized protein LOC117639927 n=1 Tax=Thrips palmi TaxID=161013 RepID=A0A6P8XXT8_THRPL|nr:uncharacterized protein LOC117639927 [Thrips palmi]